MNKLQKTALALALLFGSAFSAYSQTMDCSAYITTVQDDVTGYSFTTATKSIVIADSATNGALEFKPSTAKNSVIFGISFKGPSPCLEANTPIYFLFTDGSRLKINTSTGFNCKGYASIYFLGTWGQRKDFEQFTTKALKKVRIMTSSGSIEVAFTSEDADYLKNTLSCLYSKLK